MIEHGNGCYMTVGELRERISELPSDMPVYYQRIEDVYFEKHGWDKAALKLYFEKPDCKSDYVKVFSAYKHPDKDVFVLNAHY